MAGTLSWGSKTDVEVALEVEVEVAVADDVRTVSSFPDDGLEQRKKGRLNVMVLDFIKVIKRNTVYTLADYKYSKER